MKMTLAAESVALRPAGGGVNACVDRVDAG